MEFQTLYLSKGKTSKMQKWGWYHPWRSFYPANLPPWLKIPTFRCILQYNGIAITNQEHILLEKVQIMFLYECDNIAFYFLKLLAGLGLITLARLEGCKFQTICIQTNIVNILPQTGFLPRLNAIKRLLILFQLNIWKFSPSLVGNTAFVRPFIFFCVFIQATWVPLPPSNAIELALGFFCTWSLAMISAKSNM